MTSLPADRAARKATPITSGVLDYFPAALADVARVSAAGNAQHNAGEPLHHARGKSMDHADALLRHLIDRGSLDTDGLPHSAKVAWRALAILQEEKEAAGAPLPRGARAAPPVIPHYLAAEMIRDGAVIPPDDLPVGNRAASTPLPPESEYPAAGAFSLPPNCDGSGNTAASPNGAEDAGVAMTAWLLSLESDDESPLWGTFPISQGDEE